MSIISCCHIVLKTKCLKFRFRRVWPWNRWWTNGWRRNYCSKWWDLYDFGGHRSHKQQGTSPVIYNSAGPKQRKVPSCDVARNLLILFSGHWIIDGCRGSYGNFPNHVFPNTKNSSWISGGLVLKRFLDASCQRLKMRCTKLLSFEEVCNDRIQVCENGWVPGYPMWSEQRGRWLMVMILLMVCSKSGDHQLIW